MDRYILNNANHLKPTTVGDKPKPITGPIYVGGKSGLDPVEWFELLIQNTEGKVQFDPNCRIEEG